MDLGLQGKVALITGAGSQVGFGKAIALTLAKEGCDIVAADIDLEGARKTATEVESLGRRALAVRGDITSGQEVNDMVKLALDNFGKIDILVNNAGVTRDNLFIRMKEEDWDQVMDINLKGVFLCTKAVVRKMIKQKHGRIINLASVVGVVGNPGQANYCASKAGVIGLTKSLAKEIAGKNITVNAIAPGFIETDMTKVLPENVKESMLEVIPMKKYGKPEDIANLVVFLSSDNANYITGQVIHVDGGMAM